jgi:hypothetical protein
MRLSALLIASVMTTLGCRGLLGIDDGPPVLAEDAGTADARDARDAADGGAKGTFCASLSPQPLFCADFDENQVAAGWENEGKVPDPGEFGGGHLALDSTSSLSAPASASFVLPALVTSSSKAAAFLLTKLSIVPTAARVEFDVRVGTELFPRGPGNVIVAVVHFVPTCSIEIVRDSAGTALAIYGAGGKRLSVTPIAESFPVGAWKRVTIFAHDDLDGGSGGTAAVDIDHVPAASAPIPSDYRRGASEVRISVGAPLGAGPMGAFRANVDNVRVYTID